MIIIYKVKDRLVLSTGSVLGCKLKNRNKINAKIHKQNHIVNKLINAVILYANYY